MMMFERGRRETKKENRRKKSGGEKEEFVNCLTDNLVKKLVPFLMGTRPYTFEKIRTIIKEKDKREE